MLEIRGRLDQIDTQIEKLFEERMRLCSEVAEYKIATGKAVYDAEREKQKIESVQAMAEGEFNKQAVAELFLQMMTLSRRYQYQTIAGRVGGPDLGFHKVEKLETAGKRVVFQGLEGAYGHAAALQFFGKDADIHHVRRFEDMMVEIQEGKADFAVLPIENSSAGAVTDNYDLLLKYDNVIVAETFLPVHHYLLGTPDAELSDEKDPSQAAVAGEVAGEIYGLKKLAGPINNCPDNTTRFLILAKDRVYQAGAEKISLCFELPHRSGTLYSMLGNFIFNDVNMRMIESRPIPEESWQYRFFVDIEGNLEDAGVQNALYGIMREAKNVKILGNY